MTRYRIVSIIWTLTIAVCALFSTSPLVENLYHRARREVASVPATTDPLEAAWLQKQAAMDRIYSNASNDLLAPMNSRYLRAQASLLGDKTSQTSPLLASYWDGQNLDGDFVGVGLGMDSNSLYNELMDEMTLAGNGTMQNRQSFGLSYALNFGSGSGTGFGGLGDRISINNGNGDFSTIGDSLPLGYSAIGTNQNTQAWGGNDPSLGTAAGRNMRAASTKLSAELSAYKPKQALYPAGITRSAQ